MPGHSHSRRIVAALFAALTVSSPTAAQTMRDDFAGPDFAVENWFPCQRDENELSIVAVPDRGFNAAKLLVRPRHDLVASANPALSLGHAGCRREAEPDYVAGPFEERAELWEADAQLLKFGTEVWYRFAMYIDPALAAVRVGRVVIGQWKQEGGHSPFLAQRFVNGQFVITIEQDNDAPASEREDAECRIVIAFSTGYVRALRGEFSNLFQALPSRTDTRDSSIAHDQRDAVNGLWSRVDPCARNIEVTRLNDLPDPVGVWTTMLYHIRAGVDGDGLIEVWADGKPVAQVRGRIGFRDRRDDAQYFKFGPYRSPAKQSLYALLARFARGATRAEVE